MSAFFSPEAVSVCLPVNVRPKPLSNAAWTQLNNQTSPHFPSKTVCIVKGKGSKRK